MPLHIHATTPHFQIKLQNTTGLLTHLPNLQSPDGGPTKNKGAYHQSGGCAAVHAPEDFGVKAGDRGSTTAKYAIGPLHCHSCVAFKNYLESPNHMALRM